MHYLKIQIEDLLREGEARGKAEGKAEGILLDMVKAMLKNGISKELAAKTSGYSLQQIEKIAAQMA